jgi:xanthine dehydrogenase accessory factor
MLVALIRGGGDLASGIAVRLHRAGIKVIISEISQPLAVRRYVSFAEAVYTKTVLIEEITGVLVKNSAEVFNCFENDSIPVIIDDELSVCKTIDASVFIDARMLKRKISNSEIEISFKIGIGPGFFPGENCQCVVETKRGPFLGRVYWNEAAEADNGIPDMVEGFDKERVLRTQSAGVFKAFVRIGDIVSQGEKIASVNETVIIAPFRGVIRGLLHEGLFVTPYMKLGDLDPRCDPLLCSLVSDKALAIGGGVLEAILSIPENRDKLSIRENNETH